MSEYVPSMVLLGGLYLEHRKEKLGKRFDTDEAWQEFMQFIKNKQADAWDEAANTMRLYVRRNGLTEAYQLDTEDNPYRKQEEA